MADSAQKNKSLIQHLSQTQIYQDYEAAFHEATGLPLAFRPMQVWNLVQNNRKNENPFCSLMAQTNKTCAACLQVQEELTSNTTAQAKTVTCFAGLCDSAVPVRMGEEIIGFLQTGQAMLKKPTKAQFNRLSKRLIQYGMKVDLKKTEEAYYQSKVLNGKQYESVIRLLTIFAQHLSLLCNQLLIQEQNVEPPTISRAKKFIQDHQDDDISLGDVAGSVNTSTFYFSKMFKKATGLNFTEYLSRLRIEKAKNLLLNPNLRISEIAYQVGFQSLTHFNRVFRKIAGRSPTDFRKKIPFKADQLRN